MKNFFSSGLALSSIMILMASGCADKPLPIPPGTDSPSASTEGGISGGSGGQISQETFRDASGSATKSIQEEAMASSGSSAAGEGSVSGGLGGLAGKGSSSSGSASGNSDDFLSGPLTGDGSVSGGLGKFGGSAGSGMAERDSNNGSGDSGSPPEAPSGRNTSEVGDSPGQVASMVPFHTTEHLKDIFFAYDKHDLNDKSKSVLKENASWLKNNPKVKVEIQGHCDERGTNNYNLGLGERRAQSTKNYLVSLGVAQKRILTISYGEEKPFCVQRGENCWWQNRRGHFMISK